MDCIQIQEYLSEYADGRLDDARREQIEAHLKHCLTCRSKLDAILQLSEQLHALRITNTDDFVLDMSSVKAPLKIQTFKKWVPRIGALAACFVLVIGCLLWGMRGIESDMPKQPTLSKSMPAVPKLAAESDTPVQVFSGDMTDNAESSAMPRTIDALSMQPNDALQDSYNEAMLAQEDGADVSCVYVAPAAGNAVSTFEKHVINIMVLDEAHGVVHDYISSVCLADFGDEIVLEDAAVASLLSMEGVRVISDTLESVETDVYSGKTVIIY